MWTHATVVPRYLRLLVAPSGQSLDHDVPLARSHLDPGVVPSLALLAAIAALLAWMVRAASRGRLYPAALVVALGLAWFFAAQGVEILVPLPDVMVEHRRAGPRAIWPWPRPTRRRGGSTARPRSSTWGGGSRRPGKASTRSGPGLSSAP